MGKLPTCCGISSGILMIIGVSTILINLEPISSNNVMGPVISEGRREEVIVNEVHYFTFSKDYCVCISKKDGTPCPDWYTDEHCNNDPPPSLSRIALAASIISTLLIGILVFVVIYWCAKKEFALICLILVILFSILSIILIAIFLAQFKKYMKYELTEFGSGFRSMMIFHLVLSALLFLAAAFLIVWKRK